MPAVSPIQVLKLPPYAGGEVDIALEGLGAPGGLHRAINVDIDRYGVVQRAASPSDNIDSSATDVGHLFTTGFRSSLGTIENPYVVGVSSNATNIHHNIGGTYKNYGLSWGTPSNMPEYWVGMAQAGDKVYVTTRRILCTPVSIDNAGTEATVAASDFDGTSARFPRAAHLAYHQSQMFAASVQYVTLFQNFPSRVHWSNPGDPETWDATDFIDFSPEDGEDITALVPFGEDLVVFKESKIFILSGRSEASFTSYRITDKYGTFSPKTVIANDGYLYFADRRYGFVRFDGSGFEVISDPIRHRLVASGTLNSDPLSQRRWAAVIAGNYYYVSANDGVAEERCFAYNIETGSWTEHHFGFEDGSYLGPSTVHLGNADQVVLSGWPGLSKLGIPFDGSLGGTFFELDPAVDPGCVIRTPWYVFSPSALRGRLRRLTTVWQRPRGAASTIEIRMYVNGSDTVHATQTITLAVDPGGPVNDDPYLIQVEPQGGWSDTRFTSVAFEVEFTGRDGNEYDARLLSMALSLSFDTRGRGPTTVAPVAGGAPPL